MNTEVASPTGGTAAAPPATPQSTATAADVTTKVDKFSFSMSPLAVRKLYENLRKRGTPDSALRVGVRGGGCSGYSYVLEFADKPARSRDLVFRYAVDRLPGDEEEPGDVKVLCDKKSILFLNGSTLDFEKTLMYRGFRFRNPTEKSSCGCKESFAI